MDITNYVSRLYAAEVIGLTPRCFLCYENGNNEASKTAYSGILPSGDGTLVGNRPQDQEFQKAVWQAAEKHIKEIHGLELVLTGDDAWKAIQVGV